MLKKLRTFSKLSLESKRAIAGYCFIAPFLIGFILFFLYPIIQSIMFSLSKLQISGEGFELIYVGLSNFHEALFIDPGFTRTFVESTVLILSDIPAVIIFSLFAAALLNQKFKARFLVRVIFFLPVILTAGIILEIQQGDFIYQTFGLGGSAQGTFGARTIEDFLLKFQLPGAFIEYIVMAVGRTPDIIQTSAIPILIFLAGFQSIPSSLYECAEIEGANAWDQFWKITFPLLSPMLMANTVYIVVYSFTDVNNPLVGYIQDAAWGSGIGYGVSTAMSWMFFSSVLFILALFYLVFSKRIVYMS